MPLRLADSILVLKFDSCELCKTVAYNNAVMKEATFRMFESVRKVAAEGWLIFSVLFLVLLACLCPTIYPGDSSVIAAASFSLGSAHPPGYPLLVILGKLLTFLPFGNVAFKVNLVSALSAALACLMVFRISMELTESRSSSWAAAIICGISPLFFSASLIAKGGVYTLNSFLALCVFYLGIKIIKGKDFFRNSFLAFFLIGLGMGNHQTIGFMGLIVLLPLALRWRDFSLRWALLGLLFFLSGLSVYLFLYLRSLAFNNHGGLILYSSAGTLQEFIRVFFRQEYAHTGASSTQTLERAFSFGNAWVNGLRNTLYYVAYRSVRAVLPFLLLGLVVMTKRLKLLAYFVLSGIVWFLLLGKLVFPSPQPRPKDVEIVAAYFLPIVPILYCLVAVGFASILSFIRKRQWSFLARFAPYALAVLPFVFLPYPMGRYSLNRDFLCYDYGRDMLMSLPEKSLIMNHGDNSIFTAFYMKGVERLREDVLVIDTAGRKSVFGLECVPEWKYSKLFPKFYSSLNSTISELNDEFALRGKLFVDDPHDMTEIIARFYNHYPYLFSAALWPKKIPAAGFESNLRTRFKEAYKRINYETALEAAPSAYYHMSRELLMKYSLNTLIYSDYILRDGDVKGSDAFQKLAFLMAPPDRMLWPYIDFLLKNGGKDHALSLLSELKKTKRYGEFARFLEKRALSGLPAK